MADWKDNKDSGPWNFTEQPNKWGYLNNPRWSNRQDSIDFCEGLGLEAGSLDEHKPCGHWHKSKDFPMPVGRWVAAMQQPGTPYIYLYNIGARTVIRVNTALVPPIVDGILRLNSTYDLDYDMGPGNPGTQRGGYCMNKNGTRIWYLFTKSDGNRSDAELIEVDITSYYMKKVKSTLFPNLVPSEALPSLVNEQINDGCSDNTHTYWPTTLVAGRIIKIRDSDHVIVDDHYFNYPIEGCSAGTFDEPIATIDINQYTEKLYWSYCRDHTLCIPSHNACQHFVRSDIDFVEEINNVTCATGVPSPGWQNMIRFYSDYILHHHSYHPSFGPLIKRGLDCVELTEIEGTNNKRYACIKSHESTAADRPIIGVNWATYWAESAQLGGDTWQVGEEYLSSRIGQQYLQNILGIKDGKVFTLMYVNDLEHPSYLYCVNFLNMDEISRMDVAYNAGQTQPPNSLPWDWTSVSAMNEQTGRILLFRYHRREKRNYAACYEAKPNLYYYIDARFERIYDDPTLGSFGEPQSWPFEGFTAPPVPSTDPPVQTTDPNPGPGEIPYVPPSPPNDPDPDNVPILQSGFMDYMNIGPGETIFFKIVASVSDCTQPIQISNTSQSQEPHTVHLLIKRGSKPTIADFNLTVAAGSSIYDCTLGLWLPAKPSGAEELYWKYNVGSQAEFVEINEPRASTTYYIMLYNNGTESVRNQRLGVSYS